MKIKFQGIWSTIFQKTSYFEMIDFTMPLADLNIKLRILLSGFVTKKANFYYKLTIFTLILLINPLSHKPLL